MATKEELYSNALTKEGLQPHGSIGKFDLGRFDSARFDSVDQLLSKGALPANVLTKESL